MIIERLPLPSSISQDGFGPRTVGGDPLFRRQSQRDYANQNQLIDELDDDWGEENEF
jgi:hypothetical protein